MLGPKLKYQHYLLGTFTIGSHQWSWLEHKNQCLGKVWMSVSLTNFFWPSAKLAPSLVLLIRKLIFSFGPGTRKRAQSCQWDWRKVVVSWVSQRNTGFGIHFNKPTALSVAEKMFSSVGPRSKISKSSRLTYKERHKLSSTWRSSTTNGYRWNRRSICSSFGLEFSTRFTSIKMMQNFGPRFRLGVRHQREEK